MNTTICILIVWQQMCQASRALTTFVNIIMTMPQHVVLYIHVLVENIINRFTLHYFLNCNHIYNITFYNINIVSYNYEI